MIVDALTSDARLAEFLELSARLYHDDPYYVAESPNKTRKSLLRSKFRNRQRALLSRGANGEPRARLVAREPPSRTRPGRLGGPTG